MVDWPEVLVYLTQGTGHPASPSSPVIGLSLHAYQEPLQPVRDLGTVVTLFLSRSSASVLVLLLVILLAVVVERLRPGRGVLQTLGSPRNPDSMGSSARTKSVERCEGMVAVAEEADAEEVEAVVAEAEVKEA